LLLVMVAFVSDKKEKQEEIVISEN
jgi:hypothetical protein